LFQSGKDFIRRYAWAAGYTSRNRRTQLLQLQRLGLLLIFPEMKICFDHFKK